MKKKIIDILPPGETFKTLDTKSDKQKKKGKKRERFFNFWWLLGIVVIGFLAFYISSPFYSKATLYLVPETESKVFNLDFEVNVSQKTANLTDNVIPGSLFEIEKETSQTFKSTGEDFEKGKAQGIIRVYNSHTPPRAITLRATTRFLSSDGGKIFRSLKAVYLPPDRIQGGKIIPSFKDVSVVAQEAGESYNIGPSKFSVPGLVGTSLYYTVWAESNDNMRGGYKKGVAVVSEKDLISAENSLKTSLKALSLESLKKELGKEFVFSEDFVFIDDFQFSCDKKEGDTADEFGCEGKIKGGVLTFKNNILQKMVLNYISQNLPALKDYDQKSLTLNFNLKNIIKDKGKMVLSLEIVLRVYDRISEELLLSNIKGLSESETEDAVFRIYPRVKKIKLDFWPFWVKKTPKDSERIKTILTPSL
jgi:hypothetical protein